jgi:hypothetical protein
MIGFLRSLLNLISYLFEHFIKAQKKRETQSAETHKIKARAYDNLQKALEAQRRISDSRNNSERMPNDKYERKK